MPCRFPGSLRLSAAGAAFAATLALAPWTAASPHQDSAPTDRQAPPEPARGSAPATPFPRGEIVDPVVCRADPSKSYALYLPSSYDPSRPAPALFLLDARGRGRLAAERFQAAAERFGWVLLSSNDSSSDLTWEDIRGPAAALFADAPERLVLDGRRIYLGGFSGTGRGAGAIAASAAGGIVGVFIAGAGIPDSVRERGLPFAVFVAAGDEDFNFREVDSLDEPLTEAGAPYRIEIFEGPHAWPPEEMTMDALTWFELRAMISGSRPVDRALAGELAAGWLEEAARRERDGDPIAARRLLGAVVRDLSALLETAPAADGDDPLRTRLAEATAAAERVASSEALARALDEHRRVEEWEADRKREAEVVLSPLGLFDNQPPPDTRPRAERLFRQLQASAEGDGAQALAARRVLGFAASHAGFYLPRDLLARHDYNRAAIALELAVMLRPENAVAWYNLACARARLGQEKKALDALEQAVGAGYRDAEHLAADEDLEPLRGKERFRELLAGLGSGDGG